MIYEGERIITERTLLLHTASGNRIVTQTELIENAKEQEKAGLEPLYCWLDYKKREPMTPPGWLVYSTWEDGCGVVYKREDGKYILLTGWQGDFCMA